MSLNYFNILPDYYFQVPDSVITNSFRQNNNFGQQDTSTSVVFGSQPQTLMTVESADTVNEVIAVPRTLRENNYIVKEEIKEDTLKYFTEYLNQLTILNLRLVCDDLNNVSIYGA